MHPNRPLARRCPITLLGPILICSACSRPDRSAGTDDTDGWVPPSADASGQDSTPSGPGDGEGEDAASDDGGTGPALPGACAAAAIQCSDDGFGTVACGWDPSLEATDWGWRVPCGADETCSDGACELAGCRTPEILFIVDRSDSQLDGDKWTWVSSALEQFSRDTAYVAAQGVRMFPDYPCAPAQVEPIVARPDGIGPLLVAPTTGASTPIRAALADVQGAFGDPDQAQAVILVTDGDETCEPDASPELEASNLFRLGIRVYTIGVSTQANMALLDDIAAAGGTGEARLAASGEALGAALGEIMAEMHACSTCIPGATSCIGGELVTCDASGDRFAASENCASGACLDATTCFPYTCDELCQAVATSDDAFHCFVNEFAFQAGVVCEDCETCTEFESSSTCSIVASHCF